MLRTLYCVMLQNSEIRFKNYAAMYKVFKECPTITEKLCNKEFRDVKVRDRKKIFKIVCYIFDFNQMIFKFSFKKWG